LLKRVLTAPLRFIGWLYTDQGRRRTHADVMAHSAPAAIGQETQRWMRIEDEEQRRRDELDRIRHQRGS
jgi:hypothetical protein